MKDKQTKRIEALARLRQNIAKIEKHGDGIRIELKSHSGVEKPPRTVVEARNRIWSIGVRDSLRSSLERNEHELQRLKHEERALENIISNENHKTVF